MLTGFRLPGRGFCQMVPAKSIRLASTTTTKKALVRLFDKVNSGLLKEGKKLSERILDMHQKRQGSPRKRKGPVSGTKGKDRFRSEEAFYENPLPDCLCQPGSPDSDDSRQHLSHGADRLCVVHCKSNYPYILFSGCNSCASICS
ncbi:hypothetical protein PVAP13_9NG481800 [Panicum virgatum]|uniref:Uncharacterized protein n=1 Tax=Panicum virgatum TaxID=38727 RepID=A0A8T0MXF7_PANVG|nr:hypothetical protein PVAP13_9NG481800 [Panicum virgatum]